MLLQHPAAHAIGAAQLQHTVASLDLGPGQPPVVHSVSNQQDEPCLLVLLMLVLLVVMVLLLVVVVCAVVCC